MLLAGVEDEIKEQLALIAQENSISTSSPSHRYSAAHDLFNSPRFSSIGYEDLRHDHILFQKFDAVRRQDASTMKELANRQLIVTLTTYPKRIIHLGKTLSSILSQTHSADRIILQLALDEFPLGDGSLPDDIRDLLEKGLIETRYHTKNLRPHLKYFYAMQEFPDAVVITIDDDIIYPTYLIESLWWSYLQFPNAVSAMRAHLISFTDSLDILPYSCWPMEIEVDKFTPSMDLIATGVGGVAYPPHILPEATFDFDAIESTCLTADDLWLKAMELVSGIPVVICSPRVELSFVPGTQDSGLFHDNVTKNANDEQLSSILDLLKKRFGDRFMINAVLSMPDYLRWIHSLPEFSAFITKDAIYSKKRLRQERASANRERAKLENVVKELCHEKSDLEQELISRKTIIRDQAQMISILDAKCQDLENELQSLRSSKAYRFGTAIATPYRKVHDALKGD